MVKLEKDLPIENIKAHLKTYLGNTYKIDILEAPMDRVFFKSCAAKNETEGSFSFLIVKASNHQIEQIRPTDFFHCMFLYLVQDSPL